MASIMQLAEGLISCDVLLSARKQPNLWRPIFIPGLSTPITPVEFLDQITVNFSISQLYKEIEIDVYKYFCDFIEELSYDLNGQ